MKKRLISILLSAVMILTAGCTTVIDVNENTGDVKVDGNGMFIGFGSSERRVSDIKVNGEALDPEKTYEVGSVVYLLENRGNGYTMFDGEEVHLENYVEDFQALIWYLEHLGGKVPEEYADPEGQERIHFHEND